jgi:hypothetical protein
MKYLYIVIIQIIYVIFYKTKKGEFDKMKNYEQVCVWPGTYIEGEDEIEEFEKFFLNDVGVDVKYIEQINTFPDKDKDGNDIEGTGNRTDILFYIHNKDIPKFSLIKFQFEILWLEDLVDNMLIHHNNIIYPKRILGYCKRDAK